MKFSYNSPFVLSYAVISTVILALSQATSPAFYQGYTVGVSGLMRFFAINPYMDWANPVDYFRLVSHAMGHANWTHLYGNFTLILLLGPMLEEKYGTLPLLAMSFATALVTGILNVMLFTTSLLGASGIAFMMIILSSISNLKQGRIPLTFVLVLILYLGKEVLGSFERNTTSEFGHILGGICGGVFGFAMQRHQPKP